MNAGRLVKFRTFVQPFVEAMSGGAHSNVNAYLAENYTGSIVMRFPPAYARGEAYQALHRGSQAAAEFQKFPPVQAS